MKIVTCMGSAWRLTDRAYVNLLNTIANDEPWDLDKYGERVGLVTDVTDMDSEEAKYVIDQKTT